MGRRKDGFQTLTERPVNSVNRWHLNAFFSKLMLIIDDETIHQPEDMNDSDPAGLDEIQQDNKNQRGNGGSTGE